MAFDALSNPVFAEEDEIDEASRLSVTE